MNLGKDLYNLINHRIVDRVTLGNFFGYRPQLFRYVVRLTICF